MAQPKNGSSKPGSVATRGKTLSVSDVARQITNKTLPKRLDKDELSESLDRLVTAVEFARSIQVPVETVLFVREELFASGITREQFETARTWVLYGDWKYRGTRPVLLLSDFYPTREQIRETAEARRGALLLVDIERQRHIVAEYFREGIRYASRDSEPVEATEDAKNDHSRLIAELQKQVLDEKVARANAEDKSRAYLARIETLEAQIAKLRERGEVEE